VNLWGCWQHVVRLEALRDGVQLEAVHCALAAFFSQDFCHESEGELLNVWGVLAQCQLCHCPVLRVDRCDRL
jgi:hypothetical protein